ncbi:hypothetical protein Syun_031193 [Stephania yunnanensis]|uniref:Uncharacterized protein n=1 Tax=Stephania yunnanensis TaxID=152371 RepID=A0AAP0HEN1_9MAGN
MAISIRNIQLEEKKKGGSWFFRRKCPCSGKKSVQVEEKFSVSEPRKQRPKTGEPSPIPCSPCPDQLVLSLGEIDHSKAKSKSRSFSPDARFAAADIGGVGHRVVSSSSTRSFNESTTGFSFPILNPPNNNGNNGKLGSHLLEEPPRESLEVFRPSDEDPVGEMTQNSHFNYSPRTRPPIEDDLVSDASSDLFEIESFSTQSTTYPMYKTRDSLDETSSF